MDLICFIKHTFNGCMAGKKRRSKYKCTLQISWWGGWRAKREAQRFRFTNHMDAISWTDSFKSSKEPKRVFMLYIPVTHFSSFSPTLCLFQGLCLLCFFPLSPFFFASLTFFSLNLMFLFSVLICFPPIGELSYGKNHKYWSLSGR